MVRRSFGSSSGGHGHGHGHGHDHHAPAGPYDAPHHDQQTEEAWLFGINPHEEYKYEGWEYIILPTYLIAFGLLFFNWERDANSFKVKTSHFLQLALQLHHYHSFSTLQTLSFFIFNYQNWAKREALARREARANGEEIEFGKWYSEIPVELTEAYQHDADVLADAELKENF